VGKDARHWCAAAWDEEHGRGKGGSGVRRAGVDFVFFSTSGACGSEWSEASGLLDVLIVALVLTQRHLLYFYY
jgi:hypothetical protein